ncbi:MerR family transcriptional regulator [Candidatus Enterococcus murrayae]|uniref:MerR family transcriptional regulator n=1 Tax=Candidatus Enterococcus murrayae TaxID=2815321 RepID=A0ABS3HIX2_9ENTE|nr:MerR family transcriptional regulator [Enterococcus sp. MJM16]MBO0453379.1 MerR family transcriptional regulator [Enterococcus sp. MJM16]
MLSISQFSRASHITPKTLRYYDEIDLLKPEAVDPNNGYRYYTSTQLLTAFKIQKLKQYEFRLAEIRLALEDDLYLLERMTDKRQEIQQKMTTYHSIQTAIETDIAALAEGGSFMFNQEPPIEIVENVVWNIISVRKTMNIKDFDQLMAAVYQKVNEEKATPVYAPLTLYHSPEYTPENYDVEIAIPILEEELRTRQLHAERCVKYHFHGNYQGLPAAYAEAAKWIDDNEYVITDAVFEIYLTNPSEVPAAENEVDIYFPIKAK